MTDDATGPHTASGDAPKTERRTVHWLPVQDVLLPYFQYRPPTSVYDWYLSRYRSDHLPVELHCPAVRLLLQNTFVFSSPTFFRFRYHLDRALAFYGYTGDGPGKDLRKDVTGVKNQEYIGPGSALVQHGVVECRPTDIPEMIRGVMPFHTPVMSVDGELSAVFQLPMEVIFVSDRPLWLELLPPYLHDAYAKMNVTVIPGTFDFSNWVRNTSVSYRIRDFGADVAVRRDDPLFYVRFYSANPYETVKLELLDPVKTGWTYEEILKENRANVSMKSYAPNLSWTVIRNRFNGWKTNLSFYMAKSNPFRSSK
jgi:hypothetical protein